VDQDAFDCIEFDGFSLNPKDRLLLRQNRRINLDGKGFDILVYLATRPNIFVTHQDLLDGVWGTDTFVEESNITGYISKIRDALDDNDRKNPRFIETVYGRKGYRFVARHVRKVPCYVYDVPTYQPTIKSERSFQIESHKFVPIFLDSNCYEQIQSNSQRTLWAEHKPLHSVDGTLHILPTGVGVWHIPEALSFTTLTDLAIWRRESYHEIIEERHEIFNRTSEILSTLAPSKDDPFYPLHGRPGYVLSLMVLGSPLWEAPQELRTALKLLSCLTPLQSKDVDPKLRDKAIRLEAEILRNNHFPDVLEFGLSGSCVGFASWSGVSYHELTDQGYSFTDRIIEFEIALQGLWWFTSCIKQTCLSMNPKSKSKLKRHVDVVIRHFARLKNIGPTEPMAQRTMSEAILTTSRLEGLLDDTIKLYDQM
jgi:DNA-binding winged helix-turn-helix (wHTH) protein